MTYEHTNRTLPQKFMYDILAYLSVSACMSHILFDDDSSIKLVLCIDIVQWACWGFESEVLKIRER